MEHEQDTSVDLPAESDSAEELPLLDLETMLTRPPSRRKRLIQLGIVGVALTVLLVTFGSLLIPRQSSPAMSPPPSTILIISSNISAGTIQMNRQRQHGTFPMSVTLQ